MTVKEEEVGERGLRGEKAAGIKKKARDVLIMFCIGKQFILLHHLPHTRTLIIINDNPYLK